MSEGKLTRNINQNIEKIWEVTRDFGGINLWLPGISEIRVQDNVRYIKVFGADVAERLVKIDEENRTICYSVISGVELTKHLACISLIKLDDDTTQAIWSFEVEPDSMEQALAGIYNAGLEALEKYVTEN
jgi:hypothetical protein